MSAWVSISEGEDCTLTATFSDPGCLCNGGSRSIRFRGVSVRVDMDNDNNNESGVPDCNPAERAARNQGDPKLFVIATGDSDEDYIPDFAEGTDKWPEAETRSIGAGGGELIPIKVDITKFPLSATSEIIITYDACDPAAMTRTAAGYVSGLFELTADKREFSARLWPAIERHLPVAEASQAQLRYDELLDATYCDLETLAAVPAGVSEFTLVLTLREAIKVSATFQNPRTTMTPVVVMTREGTNFETFIVGTQGTLNGVRKGAASDLAAVADTPEVWFHTITAQQASSDVALGNLTYPEPSCTAPVSVELTNLTGLRDGPYSQLEGSVTFIKKDEPRAFISYYNTTLGRTVWGSDKSTAPFKLPPGEYYVLPGIFGSKMHWKVYDLVKGNHQTLLDAAHIPTITAADGQTAEGTIDAKKVRDDIRAIPMP